MAVTFAVKAKLKLLLSQPDGFLTLQQPSKPHIMQIDKNRKGLHTAWSLIGHSDKTSTVAAAAGDSGSGKRDNSGAYKTGNHLLNQVYMTYCCHYY